MDSQTVLDNVREVADSFARERSQRQSRRELVAADFDRLRDAGYLMVGVPQESGGLWQDVAHSTRPIAEILRTLAHGDPSVALVSSMHPAVLVLWLASDEATPDRSEAWTDQRRKVFQTVTDGAWWGTITSEPGSGGDIAKTRSVAKKDGDGYRVTGEKHFGSGSGITSYMITTARPDSEEQPDFFFMDMRDAPWDRPEGVKLTAPWDGHGMIATQSHAMSFDGFPATRIAWRGDARKRSQVFAGFYGTIFTAVILGVVETAVETARRSLQPRRESLRPYEQVEWSRIVMEGWLAEQAYEGMLRAVEQGRDAARAVAVGKTAVAELSESCLTRICRVLGGGTFSRQGPFGFWLQDVRALGFLRPPWGLAYDGMFEASWD